ncbi:MAG TPA: hypothetical protein VF169_23730 [Albitalea sp.]|uniref:hypothetical protein n=1 Tax=Piscinibacter sp. TaxID=1903157 RepID=UPI002ED3DE29
MISFLTASDEIRSGDSGSGTYTTSIFPASLAGRRARALAGNADRTVTGAEAGDTGSVGTDESVNPRSLNDCTGTWATANAGPQHDAAANAIDLNCDKHRGTVFSRNRRRDQRTPDLSILRRIGTLASLNLGMRSGPFLRMLTYATTTARGFK